MKGTDDLNGEDKLTIVAVLSPRLKDLYINPKRVISALVSVFILGQDSQPVDVFLDYYVAYIETSDMQSDYDSD